jgi:YbbR domain-containing protein
LKKNLNIIITALLFSFILWISITLSEEFYNTYTVSVNVIDVPYGYTLATDLPDRISLKLRGIGWRLSGLGLGSEAVFNVSAHNDSGKISANLNANLVENPWLSSEISVIDISPDTISFFIERIISKKLPVVPELDVTYKMGFSLASEVKVSPDSVIVFGPKSILEDFKSFSTAPIRLASLDTQTKIKATFGNGKFRTNITAVEVFLDVQRIVDKSIENVKVEVIDIPSDRDVVMLPNSVSCLVKGGINVLGKLEASDIRAYVQYADVLLDTLGTVKPEIDLPENVELISTRPERLRYIIKKFN